MPTTTLSLSQQIIWLLLLAIPIACIAWTVTHEEIFAEPRNYCQSRSKTGKTLLVRKFFYLFTCEYCFSHYVTAGMLIFTGFKLLINDWRGYILAGFALVWVANVYMSIYNLIRSSLKVENIEAKIEEIRLKEDQSNTV